MRKRYTIKYGVIAVFILTMFFLGIMTFLLKNEKNLTVVDKTIKDAFYYVAYAAGKPIRYGQELVQKASRWNDLYEEYEKLKEQTEKTGFIGAKYNEALKVIEELESMLELNATLVENTYLNATVISRNLGYWYDKITVDKGSKNGVEVNDAVVTSGGLIGKVVSTSYATSDIKLLTNDDVSEKISVKINLGEEEVYGLLTDYNKENKVFIVEGIASNIEIPYHSEVTTTGLGDRFPSGILIGYVKSISKDHFDLARTIEVSSNVDFDGVSYVTILKRKAS